MSTARKLLTVLASAPSSNVTSIPSQSLTDLTGGNKDLNWSAGSLTGSWSLSNGTVGGDPGISEVASNGGAGTGAVKFTNSAGSTTNPRIRVAVTTNDYIDAQFNLSVLTSSTFSILDTNTGYGTTATAIGTVRGLFRASITGNGAAIYGNAVPINGVIDYAEMNRITVSAQQTGPSANQRISAFYTLPASPVKGSQLWLLFRISSFASANYWRLELTYSGTGWDVNLYSVTSGSRSLMATATGIGATNGMRINANGNLIDIQTTADGGSNWTTRGTQVNNSLYNTATGYNTIWTSDFSAPSSLMYEPAV